MIAFACKHCKNKMTVKEELAGKSGKCPKCGKPMKVPDAAETNDEQSSSWEMITSSSDLAETAPAKTKDAPKKGKDRAEAPSGKRGVLMFGGGTLLGLLLGGLIGYFVGQSMSGKETPGAQAKGKTDAKAADAKAAEKTPEKKDEHGKKDDTAKKAEPKNDKAKEKEKEPEMKQPLAAPAVAAKTEEAKPEVKPMEKPAPVAPRVIVGEVDELGKDSGGTYVELKKSGLLTYKCYYDAAQAAAFGQLKAKQTVKIKGLLQENTVIETFVKCEVVK